MAEITHTLDWARLREANYLLGLAKKYIHRVERGTVAERLGDVVDGLQEEISSELSRMEEEEG